MSSGSLAARPASGENAEAAVEGRGAGLAAKARCPAAVVSDCLKALAGQGPRGCARAPTEACGRGGCRVLFVDDLPTCSGGRAPAAAWGPQSRAPRSFCWPLAWSRCGLGLPDPAGLQLLCTGRLPSGQSAGQGTQSPVCAERPGAGGGAAWDSPPRAPRGSEPARWAAVGAISPLFYSIRRQLEILGGWAGN